MECNEHYLHSFNISWGRKKKKAWLQTFVLMTHDCFLEIWKGGEEKNKTFNKRTPDTKQHFTFVVVKKNHILQIKCRTLKY